MIYPDSTITALLGEAIGDSFGCPFEYTEGAPEYATLSIKRKRYLDCFEDCHQPLKRCRTTGLYSDDTQQALILLWIWERLQVKNKSPLHAPTVAELFIKICKRMSEEPVQGNTSFGVHRGTGQNFRSVILRGVVPDSAGLGGAMRIGPVATLLDEESKLIPWVLQVTSKTTSSPIALAATLMFAREVWGVSHGVLTNFSLPLPNRVYVPREVLEGLELLSKCYYTLASKGEQALIQFATSTGLASQPILCAADGFALTGIPWVLYQVHKATTFEEALLGVCSSGGDTDTVGAMVGCLAALKFGRASIPPWMTEKLVGFPHILNPSLWHPIETERAYVAMDVALQEKIEQELKSK